MSFGVEPELIHLIRADQVFYKQIHLAGKHPLQAHQDECSVFVEIQYIQIRHGLALQINPQSIQEFGHLV